MEKMKNTICLLLFILLCAIFPVHAQVTEVCVGNGIDTVTLFVDNYQYGQIQWQRSDDTLHWTDITGANDTVYRFLPDKICFYRAWMQYPNCPADSSPITHIQFVPKADAGHDRVLNTGYVTHLNGNAVNDARYMWHVIEGDSANIENPYSHQSQFSGPDTLYRLTWTVANACGVSIDTVEIRYMESLFYDAIAVVDTTDILLSDSAELAAGVYTIVFSNPAPIITDSTILMGLVDESFLRKVLSFEYFGDTCKMITSQAYLTDILLRGPVNIETPLDFTGNTRRGTDVHYHTRAELFADPRFQNGQWSSLLQDVIQAGPASTNRYLNGFISVGPFTLSGGVMLKDLSLQFSDDSRFDADAWIDPDDFKLHFFATVVGDLYIDFILRFSESVNLSVTYDIPTPLSIPIGKAVKLGLFVPVEITGAMQMDSGFEIPVHITQPLDLGVFYQGYGTPSSLINGVSWRNNSGEMVKEVITDDLPNNLGLEVAFSVGAKLEVEIFKRAGAFFRALPTLSYSVCYGANGFKTESVQSFVNLDVAAYLKLFGEGSGGVTKHWTKSPMYWRSPYRLARGRWNNQYMTHPNDLTTPHALDVYLYNQDNRPVKKSKVLFVTTDGVVSTQQSGEGSSAVFVNTNDNGCANIYWRPSNGPDTKMYAVVQDCAGNNIVGSPIVYHSSIMSSPCHNSTLSLDVVNGVLRQSGGVWPYQYSANGTTWSSLKPWPLIPDTTYYVKDNNGCEANVTYKEPEVITACDLALNVEQDGFTVSMEASNGVFPLHFYVDSIDQTPNGINNNTYQHTFSGEGEHSLMVTDANGCIVTMHVQLTDEITLPVVYTVARYNTASGIYNEVMGAVTDNGGDTLLARGIEWAPYENMSYSHLVSNDFSDDGLGTFICTTTDVYPGNIYYARAYATNSRGTAYGKVIRIAVPAVLPTVTTNTVSNITTTTATCGGYVAATGGATVTARGVCWSTSPNPTIDDYYTTDGSFTGSFTSSITGLTQGTTYYVRAYATNSAGTAYGEQQSFTTANTNPNDGQPCPGTATVKDYDNNTYNTVQIGNQCWMKSNLRTTHYANGESITLGSNTSTSIAYYYDHSTSSIALSLRGYYYNWKAVMHGESGSESNPSGVQGICPTGWHLPSRAEWGQFVDYVESQSQYCCDGVSYKIAKALSYTSNWQYPGQNNCYPGYSQSTNNATGFSVVPAGYRYNYTDGYQNYTFDGTGFKACFWSATEIDNDNAVAFWVWTDATSVNYGSDNKYYGYSVRCLRNVTSDGPSATVPTVTTATVSDITATTATCGGTVTDDGGASVTERGVCWGSSANPTVEGSHAASGSGTGSFSVSITELSPGITYRVRAYATNSEGTAYGEEVTFTTASSSEQEGHPCSGTPTVTDYDGNVYNTVQIGNQCWMRDNLRTTHYANGESISLGTDTSSTIAYYYNYSSSFNLTLRGYLYNWVALMHGERGSIANPSRVQGICPTGWHVPSDAEWTQFIDYVNSQSQYLCDGLIAKAISSTTMWMSSSDLCSPGNSPGNNNATGFSAYPAGCFYKYSDSNQSYFESGQIAYFWSTTDYNSNNRFAYIRYFFYDYGGVHRQANNKKYGFSVRCLLNTSTGPATLPTVTTATVSNITSNTATCGGTITDDGGASVTERGVCWGTSANPTVEGSHATSGTETWSFSVNITDLSPGITYHVRAYATNSEGTAYGEEVTFTTASSSEQDGHPCSGTPTVTDYDGNVYNTVQIGNQCWMKENMRTAHYANGTSIPLGSSTSTAIAYRYYPEDNSSNVSTYGYLYNWLAVMNGATSSMRNPSGVQGICPEGWHVPSDAEWTSLMNYVKTQSQYVCGNNTRYIFKALASNTGWDSHSNTCAIGNNPNANNATGFSILPAGIYNDFGLGIGQMAYFWSTTVYRDYSCGRRFYNSDARENGYEDVPKFFGCSVRCLRD